MRCMLLIKRVKSSVGPVLLFSLDFISRGEWVLFTCFMILVDININTDFHRFVHRVAASICIGKSPSRGFPYSSERCLVR